jgi:hypothetical protein
MIVREADRELSSSIRKRAAKVAFIGRKTYLICFQSDCFGLYNCYFGKSHGDVEYDRISAWVTSTGTVDFFATEKWP